MGPFTEMLAFFPFFFFLCVRVLFDWLPWCMSGIHPVPVCFVLLLSGTGTDAHSDLSDSGEPPSGGEDLDDLVALELFHLPCVLRFGSSFGSFLPGGAADSKSANSKSEGAAVFAFFFLCVLFDWLP